MRYGLISDIHFGYHSGSRTNSEGVNVREQDHYDAAFEAMAALKSMDVDIILDMGDMAEVPAPKKRAILELISLVRFSGVPYYSVDGNHTSLKSSSDIHIYDILSNECDNFRGYRGPAFDRYSGVSFVPHSYDNDTIRDYIEEAVKRDTEILVGHWAADDIPYVGQVGKRDLPTGIRIFLGHYHNYRPSPEHDPTYVGSTEKTAWDQWDYPTGAGVFDSDTGEYTRIDIPTRQWEDVNTGAEDAVEVLSSRELTDRIVRLTVHATPQEYTLVDQVACKAIAREAGATAFTMRRKSPVVTGEVEQVMAGTDSLTDEWKNYMAHAELPKGVSRKRIMELGIEHLNG